MSSLYLDHFGLSKPPFQITPDLDFFFAGGHRGDILSALLHVAGHEEGIITLVAEVGSGKTLLARLMISRLDPHISTVYLANPSFSRDEILGAIARDLGLTDLPVATEARLAALHHELLRRHAAGQRVLLVIDEAHAMPPESLEEVRLLSNLETGQHKLVNIMLFGQPELDELLADSRLRQVRDRVVHRFKLTPLPSQDVSAYVDHRLRAAGWRAGALFAPAAMTLLTKASGGRARRINLLADKALLSAYAQGLMTVQPRQVHEAIAELHEDFSSPPPSRVPTWLKWAALSVGLAFCMTAVAVWVLERQRSVTAMAPEAPARSIVLTVAPPASAPVTAASGVALAASAPGSAASASVAADPPTPPVSVAQSPTLLAPIVQTQLSTPQAADQAAYSATLQPYLERTHALLRQPNLDGFTLQVAALPRDRAAAEYLKFVAQHVDSAMVFALLTHYNGRDFVSVFVGRYATVGEASAALAHWPTSIKTNKPMLRTWVRIKQDQPS